ncbi:hypothetical protein HBI56_008830 [Parastagonospora nodorum]|uniref:Uncharacterized protein n=1 Tax=Phaeosphaeria nodorum (strain SN15 / ATCC MYA-4574 / FGSC 10173) TaxID=321614 RepID=A0A7U2EQ18_PHANO|nr:hypothetical protein HBH56_236280 [Parastagonospora nodorum]QRC90938.1 hypothetical protein JI435_400750 [Parastagonospora nodorum SN15]KAH4033328.1 hypothetical protein HBI13_009250 [Parastagonospora nodorum]KAH4042136.1 hypothetical protein HBI09_009190 [Parastagonospora nodorum]KAH4135612.1 hypothetical protein HBH45_150670 [Parastagonospora nodorum]
MSLFRYYKKGERKLPHEVLLLRSNPTNSSHEPLNSALKSTESITKREVKKNNTHHQYDGHQQTRKFQGAQREMISHRGDELFWRASGKKCVFVTPFGGA